MMNYDAHPMSGMHRVCNLSPGALTHCCWGHGDVRIYSKSNSKDDGLDSLRSWGQQTGQV
jgi:hypothetical protein